MSTTQTIAVPADEPTAVTVRVFHNNRRYRHEFTRGLEPGDTVTEVFVYTVRLRRFMHEHELADEAVQLCSDDSCLRTLDRRAADYSARGNRPLLTGDVIAIDGRFHAYNPFGWHELPAPPPLEQVTRSGTRPLYRLPGGWDDDLTARLQESGDENGMFQSLSRADVVVSKPKLVWIPFIIRSSLITVTVAGHRYEVRTQRSWLLGDGAEVRVAQQPLVELKSSDVEQAITALLDVLNTNPPVS
ncbi:hypothetical protein NQK81_01280 [Amycolatopsis roodepoortensis]|uniref:hypothetical protein n=1 Tax=Amycolatopsis roodepoortensis TaxID=700274 RepID=UPI00214AF94C|nr:hypothetical protein [Amycolatopsis roodepoortensis]UUV32107.1 hypothetical protein NQK81_01280 [Amycolatopsis roodepoortensis]